MIVSVKLFAAARQAASSESIEIELPEAANIGDLRKAVERRFPEVHALARHSLFAVDNQYANDSTPVTIDSEIACIPPVSGG